MRISPNMRYAQSHQHSMLDAEMRKTMNIPNDPMILLSYLNIQLRDFYPSLTELCKALSLDEEDIINKMAMIKYHYDTEHNRFI